MGNSKKKKENENASNLHAVDYCGNWERKSKSLNWTHQLIIV